MSEETEIKTIVDEAKKPGTFSILNVLKERAYPSVDVDVYIDEEFAFLASQVDEKITQINSEIDSSTFDEVAVKELSDKRDALIEEKNKLVEKLGGSRFTFTVTGISEGEREDIYNEILEKFPMEYIEEKNPFSGEITRVEKENSKRDKEFTLTLWEKYITKISDPEDNIQESVSRSDVIELQRSLPLVAARKITENIEKIRVATAVFMMSVDEDFLAKS